MTTSNLVAMDKKKVIENLKQVELYINKLQGLDYTQLQLLKSAIFRLHDALDELKKSDWISVEDKLPPYSERVLVCDDENPFDVYVSRRETASEGLITDDNEFAIMGVTVTHWHKIDKLEV